jgi:hypothetical protein
VDLNPPSYEGMSECSVFEEGKCAHEKII